MNNFIIRSFYRPPRPTAWRKMLIYQYYKNKRDKRKYVCICMYVLVLLVERIEYCTYVLYELELERRY